MTAGRVAEVCGIGIGCALAPHSVARIQLQHFGKGGNLLGIIVVLRRYFSSPGISPVCAIILPAASRSFPDKDRNGSA
ncbi:hypothetical protein [Bradyrhizobium uaiense]|uniref:Uncharacterized protein n=1 Tax=Bradyrhizobium uaiense TaxID=2594946 RepID=A0A6P1BJ40_9BRAD|nr:hypothetical protein [Bradyrhizobium uaiense]NEU98249.1 hypothetical protein [Bradyrhizobium uaiense]